MWPSGTLGGPLGAPLSQKTTKTCFKSDIPLSAFHVTNTQFSYSFPRVKFYISTSHETLGCPFRTVRDPGGLWGGPLSQKMTKACLKSSDIPLTTFHGTNTQFPIVESSHSAILCLNFSWNTRLFIWDPGDPGMGRWWPLWARKRPKQASNHQIIFCPPFMKLTPNFFNSQIIP